jgi:hypothetical protein
MAGMLTTVSPQDEQIQTSISFKTTLSNPDSKYGWSLVSLWTVPLQEGHFMLLIPFSYSVTVMHNTESSRIAATNVNSSLQYPYREFYKSNYRNPATNGYQ